MEYREITYSRLWPVQYIKSRSEANASSKNQVNSSIKFSGAYQ
jgi:hypothetical protein